VTIAQVLHALWFQDCSTSMKNDSWRHFIIIVCPCVMCVTCQLS